MAFTTVWGINLDKDNSLVAEKKWRALVFRLPAQVSATPTAPGTDTTGPLGTTGTATAGYTHGDGTVTGFASPLEAYQKALVMIENDRNLNGDT